LGKKGFIRLTLIFLSASQCLAQKLKTYDMTYIAAIDQGTTSTRCAVVNAQGQIISQAQLEHKQYYPQPGYVEHDPEEIIENTKLAVAEALIRANLKAADIEAVGITNQRETTVVWNRETGKPYHRAIVWQDTRTGDLVNTYTRSLGMDAWRSKTGLPFATYFSGLKLKWLLDHDDALRKDAEAGIALFGTMDTWLLWTFTGNHVTDVTNASRTQLMNLESLDWDQDILDALAIPPQHAAHYWQQQWIAGKGSGGNI
jgi:glycerol kinase